MNRPNLNLPLPQTHLISSSTSSSMGASLASMLVARLERLGRWMFDVPVLVLVPCGSWPQCMQPFSPLKSQISNLRSHSTASWLQRTCNNRRQLSLIRPSVRERSEPKIKVLKGRHIPARGKRSAAPGIRPKILFSLSPWWPSARTGERVAEGRVRGTPFMVPMHP
jgi:hypothetical protein